jgi:hypothetical protein
VAIGSIDFLKTFATALSDSGNVQVKFAWEDTMLSGTNTNAKVYAAFVANQRQTFKEEHKHFKSKCAAKNCFGQVKIPFQTFQSGFQVISVPCLGDQTIKKVVL